MKKLMIAAAIVCAAVMANASTVKWGSGSFYVPDSKGGFTTDKLGKNTVNAYLWIVDQTAYDAATQSTIAALDVKTASQTGTNSGFGNVSAFADSTTYKAGDTIYSLVLYSYTDSAMDKTWTIANKATAKVDALGSQVSFTNLAGAGDGAYSISSWAGSGPEPEPTPEPTSAILMVLGLAGLALRRKQK